MWLFISLNCVTSSRVVVNNMACYTSATRVAGVNTWLPTKSNLNEELHEGGALHGSLGSVSFGQYIHYL